jgi:hypothetical protein
VSNGLDREGRLEHDRKGIKLARFRCVGYDPRGGTREAGMSRGFDLPAFVKGEARLLRTGTDHGDGRIVGEGLLAHPEGGVVQWEDDVHCRAAPDRPKAVNGTPRVGLRRIHLDQDDFPAAGQRGASAAPGEGNDAEAGVEQAEGSLRGGKGICEADEHSRRPNHRSRRLTAPA